MLKRMKMLAAVIESKMNHLNKRKTDPQVSNLNATVLSIVQPLESEFQLTEPGLSTYSVRSNLLNTDNSVVNRNKAYMCVSAC